MPQARVAELVLTGKEETSPAWHVAVAGVAAPHACFAGLVPTGKEETSPAWHVAVAGAAAPHACFAGLVLTGKEETSPGVARRGGWSRRTACVLGGGIDEGGCLLGAASFRVSGVLSVSSCA